MIRQIRVLGALATAALGALMAPFMTDDANAIALESLQVWKAL